MQVANRTDREVVALIVGKGKLKFQNNGNVKLIRVEDINDEKQMTALYKTFNILLSTSLSESFGLSVAEALAAGTKSIVYRNSTASELIEDKKNGYIVNNSEEAVQIILGEMRNLNRDKKFSFSSAKRFNIANICGEYDKLYKKIN